MKIFKSVFGYLFGFLCSVFLTILIILTVFRVTIFNQDYILKVLDDINYYENVYEDINKDFSNSLRSSGLDDTVIKEIYSLSDVERDIKNFVASIFVGDKFKVDSDELRKKLDSNIDKYLIKNILQVDKDSLKRYKDEIVSIYENQIGVYGYLDSFIQMFVKIQTYVDIAIISLMFLFVIFFIILRYVLHKRYYGVVTMSAAFMIIYLKYFVYDGIDFKNIVIISDSFSDFVRALFLDIGNFLLIVSIVCLIIGVFLNVRSSMMRIKRIKRS